MSVIEDVVAVGTTRPGERDHAAFDRYARLVRRALDVPVSTVTIVDTERQYYLGADGLPEPLATTRETPLSYSFCRHTVADEQPVLAPDVRESPRLAGNPSIDQFGVVAYAGWPIHDHEHRVIGSLCALDTERRDWTATERDLLADLAAACSAELAQRGLRAEALAGEREARDLSRRSRTLLTLSESLSRTRTLLDVTRALDHTARDQLGCVHTTIWVRETSPDAPPPGPRPDPDGPPERLVQVVEGRAGSGQAGPGQAGSGYELPLDATHPLGRALLAGVPHYVPDRETLHDLYPDMTASPPEGESCAWLPLQAHGEALGVLELVWPEPQELSDPGRVTLAALTAYTAQALQRARLLEERLDALVTLQSSLASGLPAAPGLTLGGRYLPAAKRDQVGGDWYDAVVMDDGCTAILVGDVVGHDIEAAAAMGQLRSMLRTLAWAIGDSPAATVQRLDRSVADLGVDAMATLLYAHLEPAEVPGEDVTLLWTSAGHPPPLVVDPDGTARFLEGEPDLLLGVRPSAARRHHRARLPSGTTLVLYTDGLVERRGEHLEVGLERLRASAGRHADLPVDALLDALRAELVGRTHDDDVALLAARLD